MTTSTDIYLPQQVAADFRTWLGSWDHFMFLKSRDSCGSSS